MITLTTEPPKMDRTKSVGASDLAAVFNIKPYGCERALWYEKRGVEADYPFLGNEHTRRGIFYEPVAADYYSQQTGRELVALPQSRAQLKDKARPFITCHPDRLHKDDGTPAEIKCPSREMFRKIKAEGLPDAYILQLQQTIMLAKKDVGTFVVFCAEIVELLHFDMPRDKQIIEQCIDGVTAFWRKVQDKAPEPARLNPNDSRCQKCSWRTTCQGELLLEQFPANETGDIPYDQGLADIVAEYVEAKEIQEGADKYMEDIKNRMRAAVNNRAVVDTLGARIFYRPQETMRWDTKALGVAHPELATEFKKKSVSRPLRIYPK